MRRIIAVPVVVACALAGGRLRDGAESAGVGAAQPPPRPAPALTRNAELERQVADTERAFAKTMADRDHAAFVDVPLRRGDLLHRADAAASARRRSPRGGSASTNGPQAPFSWEPTEVVVLASGNLALSSGPVRDPSGKIVATFTSIWRQEAPGVWRVDLRQGQRRLRLREAGGMKPSAPADAPIQVPFRRDPS